MRGRSENEGGKKRRYKQEAEFSHKDPSAAFSLDGDKRESVIFSDLALSNLSSSTFYSPSSYCAIRNLFLREVIRI